MVITLESVSIYVTFNVTISKVSMNSVLHYFSLWDLECCMATMYTDKQKHDALYKCLNGSPHVAMYQLQ